MIISASRRTDIPAFFLEWFFKRIEEGFLLVRNPMNLHQISRITLSTDVVDCIVFWSKNPRKMINNLGRLKGYSYYFQFSITGYGQRLEPNVPSVQEAVDTFIALSDLIGKERVIWRYDPIILTDKFDIDYHAAKFESIANQLQGRTNRCVISFVDMYKKTMRNLSVINLSEITADEMGKLAAILHKICIKYGFKIVSCAENIDLVDCGVQHGKCIDDKLIEEISGFALNIDKDPTQRPECGCMASVDIGAYNTCPHECLYCYANFNHSFVHKNYAQHDPESPLLFGTVGPHDRIHERKIFSCREIQESLFQK
jgi:hypothetical protein